MQPHKLMERKTLESRGKRVKKRQGQGTYIGKVEDRKVGWTKQDIGNSKAQDSRLKRIRYLGKPALAKAPALSLATCDAK